MRSAGCIYNDIVDKEIDKKVERTKNRPLATGKINLRKARGLVRTSKRIEDIYKFKRSLLTEDELYERYDKSLVDKALKIDQDLIKIPDKISSCGSQFLMISYLETTFYLKSQLLRDADNFSMKNSLELRTPFVDKLVYKKSLRILMKQKNPKQIYTDLFMPEKIASLIALKNKKSFSTNIYELFARSKNFYGNYSESLKFTSEHIYKNGI